MKMNFKILKASSTFHGVGYSEKKQKQGCASLLHFKNFGPLQDGRENISREEFEKYLKDYSGRNKRVTKPQFHAVMTCKGREFTEEELKKNALEVMDQLGYTGIPILIYSHSDTENNHVHIVTSRIKEDGKKVQHDLEGVRANKILSHILNQDTKLEMQNDLELALGYNFSSKAQFYLLLENKGYNMKETENMVQFFKHGAKQADFQLNELEAKIETNKLLTKKTAQVKAIIQKYMAIYQTDVIRNEQIPYTTAKHKWQSELTKFLNDTFGYQFMFFSSVDQLKPYGYILIDHRYKTIYKGSEIMKLAELMGLNNENVAAQKTSRKEEDNKNPSKKTDIDISVEINKICLETVEQDLRDGSLSDILKMPIENLVNLAGIIVGTDQTVTPSNNGETPRKKKRKKNQFF